jgi:hypothetical protein
MKEILLRITYPDHFQEQELRNRVEEQLDKHFGPEEFGADWVPHHPGHLTRQMMGPVRCDIPGRFIELEHWLHLLPVNVQSEFNQLVQNYSQALANAKRKILQPWRR